MCTIDYTRMYNMLYIRVWQSASDDGAYTCIRRCRTGLRGKERERERRGKGKKGKGKEGKGKEGKGTSGSSLFPPWFRTYSKKCMNAMFPAEETAFLTFPVAGS